MVVLVDTNVFVSALLGPKGASREVIRLCLQRQLVPLMGTSLFMEYEDVLSRVELFRTSPLTGDEREAVFSAFASVCQWVRVYFLWRPNLSDEADNHLVELAVAGGARAIITKNVKDLRSAELQFPRLRVLRPEELLEEVRG